MTMVNQDQINAARKRQEALGNRLDNTSRQDRELLRQGLRALRPAADQQGRRRIAALLTQFSELEQ